MLRTLIEAGIASRDASNARTRMRNAAFPAAKTLDEPDRAACSIPGPTLDYSPPARRHRIPAPVPAHLGAYENRSVGLASHWPFESWGRFLPEHTTAVSLLDRLLHHASVAPVDS